jgi:adenine-specific DNA-methyltransferase
MDKLDGRSLNVEQVEMEKLRAVFPQCFVEGKFDIRKLEQLIGESDDTSEEKYRFEWNGKRDSLKLAQTRSTGTLRPAPQESVDWDATQNLYIEGDNLEALKLLQTAYYRKVKMIYIDPPYNTGNDFVYNDDFADPISRYKELTSQMTKSNPEVAGRYHTNWLNMMYPRLRLAANLLRDDGVIFISIDDNEIDNLKKLCNEVFGEENFRNTILVRRRIKSLNSQFADRGLQSLNVGFEYVLVYSKSSEFSMKPLRMKKENFSPKGRWDVFWSNADRPTMRYPILGFTPQTGQWRNSKEKAYVAVANYEKYLNEFADKMTLEQYFEQTGIDDFIRRIPDGVGKNGGVQHWIAPSETSLRTSNWTDIEVSQIGKEFDLPFDNPKSKQLIMELVALATDRGSNDIILDFFSGSATTAHAVMQLNSEDGGNRKFILVQLPELVENNDDFKNICEIGEERIRRAGKKIKDEWLATQAKRNEGLFAGQEKPQSPPDTGFKVFKLDDSNLVAWDTTPIKEGDLPELWDRFTALTETIKGNRSELDVVYEVMAKMGVPLTYPVRETTVGTKKTYAVGDNNMLLVCLEKGITPEDVEAMCELAPYWIIAAEEAFADDTALSNAHYTVKARNIKMELL